MSEVYASSYKDQPAQTLESDLLRAQLLPHIGAKLCSLVHKPSGTELLLQRPNPAYRLAAYDSNYVADGECSGCDEMFPTIDCCFYHADPWRGTPLPDHGEVWSLAWACQQEQGALQLDVHGVRLPYALQKRVYFADEQTLRADYQLTNLSPFDLDFMWASHMMLNLEEGAQLAMPECVRKVVTVLDVDGSLGHYGDEHEWPIATLPNGQSSDLRLLRPKYTRAASKYFVKGSLSDGWVALTYPHRGFKLKVAWPAASVPYLGVLVDEGGWDDLYSIFLEPATATFDRPDLARLRGECATVPGNSVYRWYLEMQVTPLA
ncbi:MAG: hypothetical protein ACRC1H_19870 [Caldilineaceae bacterium]